MKRYEYQGLEKRFAATVFFDQKTILGWLNIIGSLGWLVVQYATETTKSVPIDGEKGQDIVHLQLLLVRRKRKTLADYSPIAAWFVGLFRRRRKGKR